MFHQRSKCVILVLNNVCLRTENVKLNLKLFRVHVSNRDVKG